MIAGFVGGMALVFYQADAPLKNGCETYKIRAKPVTAYVLKPPPAPPADPVIIKEKCPVVLTESEKVNTSDERVEEVNTKPRRHRRHHRVRRYWR